MIPLDKAIDALLQAAAEGANEAEASSYSSRPGLETRVLSTWRQNTFKLPGVGLLPLAFLLRIALCALALALASLLLPASQTQELVISDQGHPYGGEVASLDSVLRQSFEQ